MTSSSPVRFFRERFDVVTLPADAGAAKPARAIFEHCLGRLGLAAARVLYVGDQRALDGEAARQAGLHALDVTALAGLSALPARIDRMEQELAHA